MFGKLAYDKCMEGQTDSEDGDVEGQTDRKKGRRHGNGRRDRQTEKPKRKGKSFKNRMNNDSPPTSGELIILTKRLNSDVTFNDKQQTF